MNTIKKFCTLTLIILSVASYAQKVSVNKDKQRIKGTNIDGYAAELTGTIEQVSSSYTKYLKTFGKIKTSGNQMQLSEAEISFTKYGSPLYATVHSKGEKTTVWLGLNASEWPAPEQAEQALKDLEKVVYDFGVKFYRDQVQLDIDESERALQAAEKQTQKLQVENKNLTSDLEFNQKEKARLEKVLAENKVQYDALIANIARNKKDQDSMALVADQVKKMVEVHKERQRKVN